jgi:integrase
VQTPSVTHTQLSESKLAKVVNSTGKDRFIRDTDLRGFGVRVSPRNVKSYFVEATVQGKFVRRVIGQHPLTPLSEARKTALETLRELRYGQQSWARVDKETPRFTELATSFLANKEALLRASTLRDYQAILLTGPYFRTWHERSITEIARREVLERYRVLCSQHGVPTANRAMRVLSAFINYARAIDDGLEDFNNPVRVLAEARAKRPVRPRTSFIPIDQLGRWLNALDNYRTGVRPQEQDSRREDVWLLLHLLLMTGMRSNEARSLKWTDVDLETGTVTIRSDIAKNHREAVLPLRKLPRQVDSSKPEFRRRAIARDSAPVAGFPARRAA